MLTYADVCWHMLTYADVCWRMLTYADVCCICAPRVACLRFLQKPPTTKACQRTNNSNSYTSELSSVLISTLSLKNQSSLEDWFCLSGEEEDDWFCLTGEEEASSFLLPPSSSHLCLSGEYWFCRGGGLILPQWWGGGFLLPPSSFLQSSLPHLHHWGF